MRLRIRPSGSVRCISIAVGISGTVRAAYPLGDGSEQPVRGGPIVRGGYPVTMEYVIAGLLVLLVVAAGVGLVAHRVRRHGRERAASDAEYGRGVPGEETAILAPDARSPLGDTSEHAGRQRNGETVSDQDAERSGGSGRSPRTGGYAGTGGVGEPGRERPADDPHRARPVVGGEGEGTRRV